MNYTLDNLDAAQIVVGIVVCLYCCVRVRLGRQPRGSAAVAVLMACQALAMLFGFKALSTVAMYIGGVIFVLLGYKMQQWKKRTAHKH